MKNPKTYLTTSTLLLAFGLAGCTYVSLTEAGALVTQSSAKAVTNCTEVVGIIGLGHLSAVVSEIEEDYVEQHLSFKRVARLKY